MRKRIKQGIILGITLLVIVFTSCSANSNFEQPIEEESEEEDVTPIQGGTMSFAILNPSHLNPILINQEEDSYHLLKLIFEPLLTFDENYNLQGALAEDWNITEDGNKITLNLRKNVFWHDGEAFTAKDVKFTLDALKNSKVSSPYKNYVKYIASYSMVDDYKVEITFANGYVGNLEALTFPILPAHRYKKAVDVTKANKWSPIGTGPYQLEKYEKNKQIILKANEQYWKKQPYIESIIAKIKNNNQEVINAFETKDVELLRTDKKDWNRFGEDPQISIYSYTNQKYSFIGLNMVNTLFKDSKVREAIQLAISRQSMLDQIYYGQGEIVDFPINPSSWLYNQEEKAITYQPDRAKALLEEAGWVDTNNNNILDKTKKVNGKDETTEFAFELVVNKGNANRKKEAKVIQKNLRAVGINVTLKYLSTEDMMEKMESKEFDAILTGWNLSFIPDLSFAFHSNQIKNGKNFVSINNKEINQLLIQSLKTYNPDSRKDVYGQLQEKISQQLPYINLYFERSAIIINNRVKGPIAPSDYNIFNNIEEWFMEYK